VIERSKDTVISTGWTIASADYRLMPEASIKDTLEDVKDAWNL
jgi:acetyl esterase/lipase